MYHVAVRKPREVVWVCVCKTYSRPYAFRVARKWRKRGCDTMIEDVQQD